MTDHEYLKQMLDLTVRLTNACENDGYGSDAYNAVLTEIATSAVKFNHSRRRRSLFTRASIVLLIFVLAWSFYTILQWLKI
ncbi:hypothetical protein ES703_29592 [subsurface metagenome]